jgi:long-chain-fatty-acid--[acyl-carrier-protein] ligase
MWCMLAPSYVIERNQIVKKLLKWLLINSLRTVLWFRYRLKVEGVEHLKKDVLNRPAGVLFLPNHPAYFVDPILLAIAVWPYYPLRPMITEYMYYLPVVNSLMRFLNALPVPNFHNASNSVKRKRNDQVFEEVISGLKQGENFLIYPAGKVKYTAKEQVGGASGVQRILQEVPEANVVLVRTKGLWGSSFSRAVAKEAPSLGQAVLMGVKTVLKNLLFFTPRRTVTISFEAAGEDFPRHAGRLELNKYFEQWYNRPDGLTQTKDPYPGDSLMLISYSMWGESYLPLAQVSQAERMQLQALPIPEDIQTKVKAKLAQMLNQPADAIRPDMVLSTDLGLDSLDQAEILSFLQDEFDVEGVPVSELTTVQKVMGLAAKQVNYQHEQEDDKQSSALWDAPLPHQRAVIPEGDTIPEVFLKVCDQLGKRVACADDASGVLTFQQLKMRVLLVAEYIRTLPGEYIGILLPASVGATVLTLACQIAGKVPLMVNWTIGPRHLDAVVKLSGVQVVLTSWSFVDRLENVNLEGIDDKLIMLEDVRHTFSLKQKLKAVYRSRLSANKLLKIFNTPRDPNGTAVLLFTSGTENLPKGVPLSHSNILSNQRAVLSCIDIYTDDVMYGILPPFHSFGFTVSSLMALLGGIRVAYFPNPTDGKRLLRGFIKWKVTLLCGAPTFLKGMLRFAQPGQLDALRLCFSGAEKAPPELFELFGTHGKRDLLAEGYGITECSPVLTFNRIGIPRGGVGQPLPNVELLVIHPETLETLPVGEKGLVLAHGPGIFSGYLNPSQVSPFITIEGKSWYKTGDLGFIDSEGNLHLSGRQKRFIKIGGEMISLAAIEDVMLQAALHGHKETSSDLAQEGPILAVCASEEVGEKPRIYLFSRLPITVEEANQRLREAGFSNLVKIAQVVILPEIPIMGSGKINYRVLEAEYMSKGHSHDSSTAHPSV